MNNIAVLYITAMLVGIPLFLLATYFFIKASQTKKGLALSSFISRFGITWILLLLCLITPAFEYGDYKAPNYAYGILPFLFGPLGIFENHFSWYANVFLLLGIFNRKKNTHLSTCLFFIAAIIACTFLLDSKIEMGNGKVEYQAHIGFYLWLLSIASAIIENARFNKK